MSFKRTLTRGAIAAFVAVAPSSLPAQADVYHAVEPGDTLNSVASHYHLTPEAIRLANRLNDTRDSAPLPTMLLLIPDVSGTDTKSLPSFVPTPTVVASATTVNAPTGKTNETPRRALSGTSGSGTIVQTNSYVVKQGDTMESIAKQFSKPGQVVTATDIRRRNYISEPLPGAMLLVPVSNTTFNSSAPAIAAITSPVPSPERGMSAMNATHDDYSEVATVLPRATSGYQAPGAAFAANTPRRGAMLASRGMGSEEVRVVQPGQETSGVGAPSGPRARVMQMTQPARTALASVAQVARTGGTIRRLPDAEAVNLYRCAVGMELAVIKQSGAWSAIIMSDHSTGWIPTKYIKLTGKQVDISTEVITQDSYQGTASGNFNSSQPAVASALRWLGTPYVYGGTGRRGIDCSSLVQHAFSDCGINLPRTAAQQAKVGVPVDASQLQPGDRLYFSASGTRIDHTGLYMGGGLFVHASGRGHQVMVSRLTDSAHWNIFYGARR